LSFWQWQIRSFECDPSSPPNIDSTTLIGEGVRADRAEDGVKDGRGETDGEEDSEESLDWGSDFVP
jgi:hypothetical protein